MQMKTKLKFLFSIATVLMLLVGITGVALADVHTDLQVYAAGDTVYITGDGMNAGESVGVDVAFPDGSLAQHDDVFADDTGNFADTYVLPSDAPGGIYTVTATGTDSGNSFSTTFDPQGAGALESPTGSLAHTGEQLNNTHWKVQAGDTITGTISGATDAVVGSDGCVAVIIKSSDFGNTTLCGSLTGTTISFTWKVPATGVCNTTIVAYNKEGNNSNAGSLPGGSSTTAAGFAIVDSSGDVITDCGTTPPDATPPTVSKDASGSYDKTFTWTIAKSVDKTVVKQIGGSATFNYTVSVSHDSGTDSNVKVTGTITVTNPNSAAVNIDSVTDMLSDSTVCTVTGGGAQSLASGNTSFAYTCSLGSVPTSAVTNKATVTWSTQDLSDGSHLAGGSADFTTGAISFAENDIDECVNVTDSYAGSLGSACVGGANPTTFTYSRTIPVPQFDCLSYDNTATFTANDSGATGSASQTVKVCGPAKTGALTIGFWKTTNGQNLVKTYCNNGANNLGTYLASLGGGSGPFSGAPTNCTSLKTYVYNILNGATASNMNSMLKAQMLGTALDVWFSGPGYTSTQSGGVKPPSKFLSNNNLGSFNMDTTAICPMVDNTTTGTATCLNNLPSTDAVASGAVASSPMSMQAILDFAATSTYPFNSGVWYGGNRTKQEILKNIFDQFNNQLAFGSF